MRRSRPLVVAAALLAAVSCTNSGSDSVLGVRATGLLSGLVYFDADGSLSPTSADDSLKDVVVQLVAASDSTLAVSTAVSAVSGRYRFAEVPVGVYSLRVDPATIGDTMRVAKIDSATVTVLPGDSLRIDIGVGFPHVTVAAARALPEGRRVFVVGTAVNAPLGFSDSTVHLVDTSGAIRMTRVRATFGSGDSVRVRASTGRRQGQPTLEDPVAYGLGQGHEPTAAVLTTVVAATAAGGTRDAQMVVVRGAIVSDTARTSTSFIVTVDDSSGPLEVQLDRTADGAFQPGQLPGSYVPGNKFDVVGVLSPTGSGAWRLRPRTAVDLVEIPLPVVSIAAARALPEGRTAVVVGVALNGSAAYADSSVFVADGTGGIRLTRFRSQVSAGDSIKVRATTGTRDGQPVLDGGTATSLGRGLYPTAAVLTTVVAATAAGGTRDAQMVVVRGAIVSDTARTSTSFIVTVDDSSGPLEVQLDRTADGAFQPGQLPGSYVPGNKFDVVGVLSPTGSGAWRLRPRTAVDLVEIPLPVVSIAAARALPEGRTAVVVGVVLNGPSAFTDTTVHLADTSGAIRLTRLRATVLAGDSVRVRATTASRAGQPTLDAGTITSLGRGLFPTAATVTTAAAATAAGGTRDAQMVVVRGATIGDTASVTGDFRLTVSDGSGDLEVLLDHTADAAFQPAQLPGLFVPGNRFDLVGLLVPTGSGAWRLKPRSAADLRKL